MNNNNRNMNLNNNQSINNDEPKLPQSIIRPNNTIQNLGLQPVPLDQLMENEYYYVVDTFQNPHYEFILQVVDNLENVPYLSVYSFMSRLMGDIWLEEFQGFPFLKDHIQQEFILFYPVQRNLNGGRRRKVKRSRKSKKSGIKLSRKSKK